MTVRPARHEDLPYIDWLRRKESEAVGFFPHSVYEEEINGRRNGCLYVYEENGVPVGFIYATARRIQQVAVQEDARRAERATALVQAVEAEALRRGELEVGCRVAEGLDAEDFWRALGFQHVGTVDVANRRHRARHYFRKPIGTAYLWFAEEQTL